MGLHHLVPWLAADSGARRERRRRRAANMPGARPMSASHAEVKAPAARVNNARSLSVVTDQRTAEKERTWVDVDAPHVQVSTAWVRSPQLHGRRHQKLENSPSKLALDAGYDTDQETDGTYMSTHDGAAAPEEGAQDYPRSP